MPRARADHGSVHVLEAMLVALVMLGAVVFVSTMKADTDPASSARSQMDDRAQNVLDILYDTPVSGNEDQNALGHLVTQCLRGDCDPLDDKARRLLPPGTAFAVYVSNGYGTYPVHVPREPGGEAVTGRHLLEPAWNHSFVATTTLSVSPSEDALVVYSLPVFHGLPVTAGGSPLKVIVRGHWASDGGEYALTASRATEAIAAEDKGLRPVPTVNFLVNGNPSSAYDARSKTTLLGSPTLAKLPVSLLVKENAGVPLDAGAELTVRLPRGWNATADPAANPGWKVLSNATDHNGTADASDVRAVLLNDLNGASRTFTFNAVYLGDRLEWYPFQASLSANAVQSQAELLVRAGTNAVTSLTATYPTPGLAVSMPQPMGTDEPTTWTLGVVLPVTRDDLVLASAASLPLPGGGSVGLDNVVVTRIEIVEEEGRDIFGGVQGLRGGGTWANHGDRLVWTGSHASANGALDLAFQVTGSGAASPPMREVPFQPGASFAGGHAGRLLQQSAPGLYWEAFLPHDAGGKYRGYDRSAGETNSVRTAPLYWTKPLPGRAEYDVNALPSLRDTAYGSALTLERRAVAIGEEAVVTVDARAYVGALESLGLRPNMTINVHPPWATGPGAPLLRVHDVLGGESGAEVTGVGQATYRFDVPEGWLFGPYVVEVEVAWEQGLLRPAVGQPETEDLIQKTRLYDYFLVTPPDHVPQPSPLYDVHLVAWLEDWG